MFKGIFSNKKTLDNARTRIILGDKIYIQIIYCIHGTQPYFYLFIDLINYSRPALGKLGNKKLDQETWLCRTHLDTFWFDFGP